MTDERELTREEKLAILRAPLPAIRIVGAKSWGGSVLQEWQLGKPGGRRGKIYFDFDGERDG